MSEIGTLLGEAYHEHGQAICDSCNEAVEFDDCDSFSEAKETWNEHIENQH